MDLVIEAIAGTFLPEAVERWLDEKGTDAVSKALNNDGQPPEADWVIEQALGTYPTPLTEAAFRAFWTYVGPKLIQHIKDEIHDIALDISEDAKHGGRNSLRWNGLSASMFGGA